MRFLFLHKINVVTCKFFLLTKRMLRNLAMPESTEEKIIISMTSWVKRINNVPLVIDSILKNTVQPDKIVLNLSIEEFPNLENDLPDVVVKLEDDGVLEIGWQKGNTKAFKKIIPTMQKYPNDVIISIDDDFIYPIDFIQRFIKIHEKYPDSPLSGNTVGLFGAKMHCGCASLVKSKFYGKYIEILFDENVAHIGTDDVFYTICAALSGYYYKYVGKEFFYNMQSVNSIDGISDKCSKENIYRMMEYVNEKTIQKFNISVDVICSPKFKFL